MTLPAPAWVVVLAAGDGTRLRSVTRGPDGEPVPKQFFSFAGGPTLLHGTLSRARALTAHDRIVTVVAERHRRWWEPILGDGEQGRVVVQPENRGTAAGLLLPLLRVFVADPWAVIAVLPSDHAAVREGVLRDALRSALREAAASEAVVLLGMEPDTPEHDYGWITVEPGDRTLGPAPVRGIASFVEKPGPERAAQLMAGGALWSSFIMAGRALSFVRLFARHEPELLGRFLERAADLASPEGPAGLAALYARLPSRDFSRHVLEPAARDLRVLQVPPCGWSDLGTPERVQAWLAARRGRTAGPAAAHPAAPAASAGA